MKCFYFYDPQTGEFTGQMVASNKPDPQEFVEKNVPKNLKYIEFQGNIKNYRVNVNTNIMELKTDVQLNPLEIKTQINSLREQYFITKDSNLLDQITSLQNSLQLG